MIFRDISLDTIIFILAEILKGHFQEIKIVLCFRVASFLNMSELRVPVPELGIASLNHTQY